MAAGTMRSLVYGRSVLLCVAVWLPTPPKKPGQLEMCRLQALRSVRLAARAQPPCPSLCPAQNPQTPQCNAGRRGACRPTLSNMSDTPPAASATHAPVIHSGADVQPLLRLHPAPAADDHVPDKAADANATADATAVSVKTLEDEQPAPLGVVPDLDIPGPKGDSEHASLSVLHY
jgi:hypothetical protein